MSGTCCRLTGKDMAVLEVMLERRRGLGDPIVPLIERKLAGARMVPVDAVEATVATLNSRLAFRVDGGPVQTRTLVQQEVRGLVGLCLPLATPLGLALIGLGEGEEAAAERRGGGTARVVLERVLYQPEAARRAGQQAGRQRPALVLVHSADDDWQAAAVPLGGRGKMRHREGGDDGPSAA